MVRLLNRNPLEYPVGYSPGVDFDHIGARGAKIRFSGMPMAGGYVNLLNGKVGTKTGTPGFIQDPWFGPSWNDSGAGTSDEFSFSGNSTTLDTVYTIAGFCRTGINSGICNLICLSSTDTHASLGRNNGQFFIRQNGGGTGFPSTITMFNLFSGLNQAMFFIVSSQNGTVTNALAMDLRTGIIQADTETNSLTAVSSTDGVYQIGNGFSTVGSNSENWQGQIGPLMYSTAFLSLGEMRQWAQDPWSFWFPTVGDSDLDDQSGKLIPPFQFLNWNHQLSILETGP